MTAGDARFSGREASMARRKALSAGKAAIGSTAPAPSVAKVAPVIAVAPAPRPEPQPASTAEAVASAPLPASSTPARSAGRDASIVHRRRLSAGKAALSGEARGPGAARSSGAVGAPTAAAAPASSRIAGRAASLLHRRQISAGKSAVAANHGPAATSRTPDRTPAAASSVSPSSTAAAGGRSASLLHRKQISAGKAGLQRMAEALPTPPAPSAAPASAQKSAPMHSRTTRLDYPHKVTATATHGGRTMTGLRIGRSGAVTGTEHGATLPVSGTQYVGEDDGAPVRGRPQKVGLALTPGGRVVSGTLVRSRIGITGDERGDAQRITGKVDQGGNDDLTPRPDTGIGGPQFRRAHEVHGQSAGGHGFHLGRDGAHSVGHADAVSASAPEVTLKGHALTGTAVGISERTTGNEDGAARSVTGTQYVRPASAHRVSGRLDHHAHARDGAVRPDPVTNGKVVAAATWGGQRVTGPEFEESGVMTGSEPGAGAAITGTQYQGVRSAQAWGGPEAVAAAAALVVRSAAEAPVTGRTPVNQSGVTGTERGADRAISGTPYYRGPAEAGLAHSLADIHHAFSVTSPQRESQLRTAAEHAAHPDDHAGDHITGSFALANRKVTGNAEFHFVRREPKKGERPELTGEGAAANGRITGDSWRDHSRVTGTEGYIASSRNPSERAGKPHAFANALVFKPSEKPQTHADSVTGIMSTGTNGKAKGSRVTVSGGAGA